MKPMPSVGFRTSGLRGLPLETALDLMVRCGAREVELCLEHPDTPARPWPPGRHAEVAASLAVRGLTLGCVSWHGKREGPAAKTAGSCALVDIAAALDTPVALIAPPLAAAGWDLSAFTAWCRELCGRARDAGRVLAVEPEPDTLVPDVAAMERLLDAVDNPALGVGLDVGHAYLTEGSALAALERLGARVVHTHWDDMRDGRHVHLPPGEGEADLLPAARWLLARGWQGAWVVDLFELGPDPEPRVRAGIAGLAHILAEAMTQDSANHRESGLEPTVIFRGATKRPGAPIGRGGGGASAVPCGGLTAPQGIPPRQERKAVGLVRPNGRNEDHGPGGGGGVRPTRALILAAGRGRRLGAAGGGRPKGLLEVGGIGILERQLSALASQGVTHPTLVVGWRQDLLRERLETWPGIAFVENPRFAESDLLESFRLGMDSLGPGGWLLLGDTLFHPTLLQRLAACPADLVLGFCRAPCDAEAMKLRLAAGRPIELSKEQDPARCDGEFVGVARLGGAGLERLRAEVRALHAAGDRARLFEGAFQRLLDQGDPGLAAVDVTGEPWIEVDFPADLARARVLFGHGPGG
jgi:choline kinase/sugar phosphate isomerase/epimerase